jgi:hypothetical protein
MIALEAVQLRRLADDVLRQLHVDDSVTSWRYTIGREVFRNLGYSLLIKGAFIDTTAEGAPQLHRQHSRCHAMVTAEEPQNLAASGLADVALDECGPPAVLSCSPSR